MSREEGQVVKELVTRLLEQDFADKNGNQRQMQLENIMVVSPYNMQVNHLKAILPQGARVGTVDLFQGLEAEVVIISMAASSTENAPRGLDFLLDRKRLNVAISRSKINAFIVVNSEILNSRCRSMREINLVNNFCAFNENKIKN